MSAASAVVQRNITHAIVLSSRRFNFFVSMLQHSYLRCLFRVRRAVN